MMGSKCASGCQKAAAKTSTATATFRIYFRARNKPKVRLRGTPWSPEFMRSTRRKGAPRHQGKGGAAAHGVAGRALLRGVRGLQAAR